MGVGERKNGGRRGKCNLAGRMRSLHAISEPHSKLTSSLDSCQKKPAVNVPASSISAQNKPSSSFCLRRICLGEEEK